MFQVDVVIRDEQGRQVAGPVALAEKPSLRSALEFVVALTTVAGCDPWWGEEGALLAVRDLLAQEQQAALLLPRQLPVKPDEEVLVSSSANRQIR